MGRVALNKPVEVAAITSVQSPLYDSPLQKTSNSFGEIIQMLVRKRIQIMSHIHIEVTSSRCYQINNMQSF